MNDSQLGFELELLALELQKADDNADDTRKQKIIKKIKSIVRKL